MRRLKIFLFCLAALLLLGGLASYLRPLPEVEPVVYSKSVLPQSQVELPWPTYGQAAVGARGHGVLATRGEQKAVPIASITKVITALAVLDHRPLAEGQDGPDITLGASDTQLFEDYFARGGSVVKVAEGEKLSQLQALEAMLIPSGNNIADSLARWAFGSVDGYVKYANDMLIEMGLTKTQVADASGFSPGSVSSAEELVKIGERALSNPVIAKIVSQKSASLPVAGEVTNVNWLLGQDGVVGIKTGNTDEAGGCFLFAADREIDGQTIKLIGAILGAPTRNQAISDSQLIIQKTDSGFEKRTLVKAGEAVGQYQAPWGTSALAIIQEDISALVWKESPAEVESRLSEVKVESAKSTPTGTVTVVIGTQQLKGKAVLAQELSGPSFYWRILGRILD
ncbi:hypothetical protein A3E49_01700 [Candidatus Saccharibacteria bacterium RIFCSPHIGHO2_12_FULL_49_19]|nr:MAG: hypothetical protein A2708_02225 [Candidatus Saccharibacteria bacterium RIFCSPHIGHO2_01_FULL_49_21]OGL36411.1 MAG: hypothetical protein A3E49_01700 [Candidatus Saccharibacteria bacterium RIFCSPHIGHO2_12_FULL_49_19]OGL37962.1 MAG: hypothetical protein A3B63_01375 [Candidatus Saccharibacteria bacterium RIFCSPLOWO2_01_FULL_49_22]